MTMSVDAEWSAFARAVAGRYEVQSEIGRGGMAVVLLASDIRHHREVALKVFQQELSAAIASERFEREIGIAARLNHPHIVPLFDSGEAAGHLYYVMPFVRGESLRQRLERDETLDVALALRLVVEVCGALEYAHRNGVVHRDIKPENILLSEEHAVVADFGIARALDRAGHATLTGLGLMLGTPAYVSPEQAAGESEIDGRSDQYSLACVLYELLTGKPPFSAPTAMAVIAKQISEVAPLISTSRADITDILDQVVFRALEKAPDARFQSAAEFGRALEGVTVATGLRARGESLVVLNFLNISRDPSVEWLSTGIAETVSVDLKGVERVRLIRREKVARALSRREHAVATEDDAMEVARLLGARWVVWGGYQHIGDRIRITSQFGDVQAGQIVSAVKIDGIIDNLFAMQDEIVADVLRLLKLDASARPRAEIAKPQTSSLSAYELYARARQLQNQFTARAILDSRQLLLQALAIDSHYALAYSGLGFSHAFGFIASSDPEDLTSAIRYLERAIELDPGLGEAYAWLSYAYTRSNRLDEAVAAGARATELEPEFHFAHYFRAVALAACSELGAERWPMRWQSVVSLLAAAQLEPGSQSTYHVLVELYLSNGQYEAARAAADTALQLETAATHTFIPFVGAICLQGFVAARVGETMKAQELFQRALEVYSGSTHMFATLYTATALISLGDLARKRGAFDEALIFAQRATAVCREHPLSLGTGYAMVRAQLLAAKASASLGVASEARRELTSAETLLRDKTGYAFSWGGEGTEATARFECASTYANSGKLDEAMRWLERAYDACWNDYPSLRSDPSFGRMQGVPAFEAFLERCRIRARHPESLSSLEAVSPLSSGGASA